MKSLFELCKPRQSVFDEKKRDDVLHLMNLIEKKIDPAEFFSENYMTAGMQDLLGTAFKRFMGKGATGLVKLTQAMGGGKTHNMIALGLLAMYPDFRKKFLPDAKDYKSLGAVRVVAFNGRNSDEKFGIWGNIAEQLGKKALFKDYYSPLQAPGETAWINLLQGEPLLILLDEIPPYLENAKSTVIGHSDLAVVTGTALSNLFSALGKDSLANVCVVISDLEATYESGSALIKSSFKNLAGEVNRSAKDIEPVGATSDEVYHILRKRLFEELPGESEINDIALAYQKAVNEAKQMGYTTASPDKMYLGIKDTYPFHPAMRDLYGRFKENPGFQQTRGLIRFMRQIVAGLYANDGKAARQKYLVHVYDFDLNNRAMMSEVQSIKSSLTQAIATDIASGGKAFAETTDSQFQNHNASDAAKLILVASLADVPNALLGLDAGEIVGDLCAPGRDIAQLKNALDDFSGKAWYLQRDKKGRLFFQNTRNMIAEMQSLTESYSNEDVKATTLRKFLTECFKPKMGDCYQSLLVFPSVDEINVDRDKVTLVLFEPYVERKIHPELQSFFDAQKYKNRIMFLSGGRDTMERLYKSAKELKAIEQILANLKADGGVTEDNPQLQTAKDMRLKKITGILSAARETFLKLYYPMKDKLQEAEFTMQFTNNDYNGEEQVRKLLTDKRKFSEKKDLDKVQNICEDRLFSRKEMMENELFERAATEIRWPWYHPKIISDLIAYCVFHDFWRLNGEYIEKGPFPKEKTSLSVTMKNDEYDEGDAILKIVPEYGDKVYYEIGGAATEGSLAISDLNNFVTDALDLSFLCADSRSEHPTGDNVLWHRPITIRHKFRDASDGTYCTLSSQKGVAILYTTDGSEPKENGGAYDGEFLVPTGTEHILAVALVDGQVRKKEDIQVEKRKSDDRIHIDEDKPLTLRQRIQASDTNTTYQILKRMKKYELHAEGVHLMMTVSTNTTDNGYIELNVGGQGNTATGEAIETAIGNLRQSFAADKDVNISMEMDKTFFPTGHAFNEYNREAGIGLESYRQGEIRQDG